MFQVFKSPLLIRVILLTLLKFIILIIPIIVLTIGIIIFAFPGFIGFIGLIISFASVIALIYIYYRMVPALGFVLDRQQRPWEAIKSAFQVTNNNVLRLLEIHILAMLIFFISIIPLGIGLIWTIPFLYNLYAIIYKNLLLNATLENPPLVTPRVG